MHCHSSASVQDFHTAIAGAMTDEEYAHELYSAMLEDAQQALLDGMERAVQRCVKKAELKVHSQATAELHRIPCFDCPAKAPDRISPLSCQSACLNGTRSLGGHAGCRVQCWTFCSATSVCVGAEPCMYVIDMI